MPQFRRSVAVMATLAAVVALPATASAKSSSSALSQSAQVQAYVTKAKTSVKALKRAVKVGDSRTAKLELKRARSNTGSAARLSRRMARTAEDESAVTTAAASLTLAGVQYDALVTAITELVDQITGQVQQLIAGAIGPSLNGQLQVVNTLTSLLGSVPASIQPVLASIIAGLSLGDAEEVTNLDEALDTGTLPVGVSSLVSEGLGMATSIINTAFSTIQSILPMLPAAVQGPLSQIISMVQGVVQTLIPSTISMITDLVDTILSSLPFVGGAASATGGLPFGNLLSGILGGGGGTALPGGIGDTISSLLGSVLGGGTGGGVGGGGGLPGVGAVSGVLNTVMGLVNGLLDGFLGGVVPST